VVAGAEAVRVAVAEGEAEPEGVCDADPLGPPPGPPPFAVSGSAAARVDVGERSTIPGRGGVVPPEPPPENAAIENIASAPTTATAPTP
jgi:hypothetical protein